MDNTAASFISRVSRGVRMTFLNGVVEISVQRDDADGSPSSTITLQPAEMDAIAKRWLMNRLVDSEMRE